MFQYVCGFAVAALCLSLGACSNEASETTDSVRQTRGAAFERVPLPPRAPSREGAEEIRAASTIRIVSGEEGNAYSRAIADLAVVLEGNDWQFQAIASKGPVKDILNLLNHPEADVAIVQTDAISALPEQAREAAREKLSYLFRVPNKELHVLAPRDITGVQQLDGLKVNIDRPGTGTHLTARLLFENLGIKPEFSTDDQVIARQRLLSGELQAIVVLAARPSSEILAFPSEGRFHLLPVPLERVGPDYHPSQFTSDDYPHLVEAGRRVETAAVGRVLAIRNWPGESRRYRRLARLVESIGSRFNELQTAGHDPQWREISSASGASGWRRFKPAQELLDLNAWQADEQRAFERFAASSGICALPTSTTGYEQLYKEFIEWKRTRSDTLHLPHDHR